MEKTIQVNPTYLQVGGKQKNIKKQQQTRKRLKRGISSSTLKKEFIQKIKENKRRQAELNKEVVDVDKTKNVAVNVTTDKQNEFLSSLKELNNIISSHRTRKKKREAPKMYSSPNSSVVQVNLNTFDDMVYKNDKNELPLIPHNSSETTLFKSDPKYGLLKNGKKPTYSQLNKTLKRGVNFPTTSPIKSVITTDVIDTKLIKSQDDFNTRKHKLEEIRLREKQDILKQSPSLVPVPVPVPIAAPSLLSKSQSINLDVDVDKILEKKHTDAMYGLHNLTNTNTPSVSTLETSTVPKKRLKRYEKTCKVGKKGRSVNVLIENNKTRKRVMNEINNLDKISIAKMKDYLRGRSLIKKGSDAPDFIIKQMYKSAIMTGNVENTNKSHIVEELNSFF